MVALSMTSLTYKPAEVKKFDGASQLFLNKWKKEKKGQPALREFIDYFESQWLRGRYTMWYEGAAIGFPSTNNGIGATNAVIKAEHTLRQRLLATLMCVL